MAKGWEPGGHPRRVECVAVHPLKGAVKHYPWGSFSAIAELQGRPPADEPEAELWLGTHPRGPAQLASPTARAKDLRELIGGDLPFLFKVLAAETPLSLQAHPSSDQARTGYDEEQRLGIPLDAPQRNYKDSSHKPELICALSPFYALSGFRPPEQCLEVTRAFGAVEELGDATASLRDGDLEAFFGELFVLERTKLRKSIEEVARRAKLPNHLPESARAVAPWVSQLAERYPQDPGVVAALLLNVVQLAPGEAMYLPAGNLHAYLKGVGLEIMACSDNVMRGGLTDKHVDVQELTKILRFEPYSPAILSGEMSEPSAGVTVRTYSTPAPEFELAQVEQSGVSAWELFGPAILLVLEGDLEVQSESTSAHLKAGHSAYIEAGTLARVHGVGRLARATVPAPVSGAG